MEDNEFEEVTIISHTDHGTSVLPQSTAERLMKEIKLEVTQKISQNENVKLGSLQKFGATSQRLNVIQQNVLANHGTLDNLYFVSQHPHVMHRKKMILGIRGKVLVVDCSAGSDIRSRPSAVDEHLFPGLPGIMQANNGGRPQQPGLRVQVEDNQNQHPVNEIEPETRPPRVVEIPGQNDGLIQYILFWGDYLFVFRYHNPVEIYNLDGKLHKLSENFAAGDASTAVQTTRERVYFRNRDYKIATFERDLEENVNEVIGTVADFRS